MLVAYDDISWKKLESILLPIDSLIGVVCFIFAVVEKDVKHRATFCPPSVSI